MTGVDDITSSAEPVDGRVARRERNIEAVIEVVLQMFAEEALFPTIEQAAKRSGLSLRSLYRYFADPGELLEASIKHSRARMIELSRLHAIGQGSLDQRIEDFVAMRVGLYEAIGPVYRASAANAARHSRIRDEFATRRNEMREQFALQFAPELDQPNDATSDRALAAGDLITQVESIDFLRRHRQLSVADTRDVLVDALTSLLG